MRRSEAFTLPGYDGAMLPIPTPSLFRSRRKAMWYAFWVILAAVLSVPFAPGGTSQAESNSSAANVTDATGEAVDQADFEKLAQAMKAN